MNRIIPSQLRDTMHFIEGLERIVSSMDDNVEWGNGLRLTLPAIIPLRSDYEEEELIVAWLVANDFGGYDLVTSDPTKGA